MTLPLLAMILGSAPIKVGDKAPDFALADTEGREVRLSEMLRSGPAILFFFPKAFTPG